METYQHREYFLEQEHFGRRMFQSRVKAIEMVLLQQDKQPPASDELPLFHLSGGGGLVQFPNRQIMVMGITPNTVIKREFFKNRS